MSPTKAKYELLKVQRHRVTHRPKLLLCLKISGIVFVSLMLIVLISTDNHARKLRFPHSVQKSEEFKQFEILMKTHVKKIFFIETTLGDNYCLKLRQSCAVESAARMNPEAAVVVLLRASSVASNCTTINELQNLSNLKIVKFTIDEIFDNTPLMQWGQKVDSGEVKSPYIKSHLSDALRLAVLHKYTGIYVDLDFIVLRSFDKLFKYEGFLAREASTDLNGALMGFRGLKSFTNQAMTEFGSTYRGHEWAFNGPALMKRMLAKFGCHTSDANCEGVTILNPVAFYPIYWRSAQQLFNDNSVDRAFNLLNDEKTYAIHFWNYLTYDSNSPVHYKNVLNICGQIKCPTTFQLATRTEKQNFI